LRDLSDIEDDDYVKLALVEVLKRAKVTIGLRGRLVMSALKHGFFRRGFMLCNRCVLNRKCESFVPSGEYDVKKRPMMVWFELLRQYGLKGLADEILVGRVAMYLIRIVRAEVYEANS